MTVLIGTSTFLKGSKTYKEYTNIGSYRISLKLENEKTNQGFGIESELRFVGANVLYGTFRQHRLSYFGILPYYYISKKEFRLDLGFNFSILLKNEIETNYTGISFIYKRTDIGLNISPAYKLISISGKEIYINSLVNYSLFPIYTEGKGRLISTKENTRNFSILFGLSFNITGTQIK
jgi:hypothetical protein